MTARLAGPPTRLAAQERRTAIGRALAQSEARVSTVMAAAPWPDPASRDQKEIAWEAKEKLRAAMVEKETIAAAASAEAATAQAKVGILGRCGLPTTGRREADRLHAVAEAAERQAEAARYYYGADAQDAEARAPGVARIRRAEQDRWEQKPEVRRAVEEKLGNELVKRAIGAGDKEIEALAGKDLAAAREEMLLRKAQEEARLAEELRLQQEREMAERMAGYKPGAGPPKQ